eukprot:Nitzschia sp. Nitz4//scaffold36_size144017//1980//5854//NITZ4_003063-RA/size144017-augustus-gene-0.1-mRNA-1//1//CDS//3329549387//4936//frame0
MDDSDDITARLAREAGVSLHRFPQTNQEAEAVEQLVKRSMEAISMEEHEKVIFDIHGFLQPEEDEEALEQALGQMRRHLLKIDSKEKQAYLHAQSLNDDYVSNRKFLIMFLRYQEMDPEQAARNLIQHFETKRQLFGNGEILARDIRQSDLSDRDLRVLYSGFVQILATRDAAGRAVFVTTSMSPSLFEDFFVNECGKRVIWYMSMIATQDETTQRNGTIWICLMDYHSYNVSADQFRAMQELQRSLPCREISGHFCYHDPSVRPFAAGVRLFAKEHERSRLRIHTGTPEQIIFKLQTFGLPVECIKFRNGVHLDETEHLAWLAAVRSQEGPERTTSGNLLPSDEDGTVEGSVDGSSVGDAPAQPDEGEAVLIPRRFDVLFGKTNFARRHMGTQRALHLVEIHFDDYERLGKQKKKEITDEIIAQVHGAGGRFLRQTKEGVWVVTDGEDAHRKVSHWFRHARYKKNISPTLGAGEDSQETGEASGSSTQMTLTMSESDDMAERLAWEAGVPLHRFPETHQEAEAVEKAVQKAIGTLTMEEHEKIIFEIHGFSQSEEDQEALEDALQKMKHHLLKTESTKKQAYLLAQSLNDDYVSDRKFLIMFLRYRGMNPEQAAQTLIQHFETKRQLFGEGEVLARDVRQSDLSARDMNVLNSGFLRLLGSRDVAGRAIFVTTTFPTDIAEDFFEHDGGKLVCWHYNKKRRALWYTNMLAIQDEATQRNGAIWVCCMMNRNAYSVTTDHFRATRAMQELIPCRGVGSHFCYQDPSVRPFAAGIQLYSKERGRSRMRVHTGTPEQVVFLLQTFGIPAECLKFKEDGSLDDADHLQWLAVVRSFEEQKKKTQKADSPSEGEGVAEKLSGGSNSGNALVQPNEGEAVLIPRRFDVLFGKTNFARRHTGTLRALHLVEIYFEDYNQFGKLRKMRITNEIIAQVHGAGGRFLRQNKDGVWVVTDGEDARRKVAHWFRHARYKKALPSMSSTDEDSKDTREESPETVKRAFPDFLNSMVDDIHIQQFSDGDDAERVSKRHFASL